MMVIKMSKQVCNFLFFFFFVLSLSGCTTQIWYLTVIDASDPAHPELCVSKYKNCYGDVFDYLIDKYDHEFEIDEYDSNGKFIKTVWSIVSPRGTSLKRFKYGTPPKGWKETMKAIPLEAGKYYGCPTECRQYYYFIEKNGMIKNEIVSYPEFKERIDKTISK